MSHRRVLILVVAVLAVTACSRRRHRQPRRVKHEQLTYPETRAADHVDEYHGTRVPDPYRWLEDPNSDETKAWVAAQNKLTFAYLEDLRGRERIRDRLEELSDYEKTGIPVKEGGRYFYRRNEGLQEHSVLYVADALDAEPRVLIDPNTLSEDGSVSLARIFPSPDGKLLCYALSTSGSDWREFKVRDVESGQDYAADHLKWIKFSGASWARDSSGFYYKRLPQPEPGTEMTANTRGGKVYFHKLGTPQDEDQLVWARPDKPDWSISASLTDDGRYLVGYAFTGASGKNALFLKDLEAGGPMKPLITDMQARYYVLGNRGSLFFLYTDLNAPNGQVVSIDVAKPGKDAWKVLVPAGKHVMEDTAVHGDRIVINYLRRAHSQVKVYALDGTFEREIRLPALGSVYRLRGHETDPEMFFGFSGFSYPGRTMRCDVTTGKLTTFRAPEVDFDPAAFTSRQVAYRSKDGTYITMFIVHRKGLKLDGNNPTLLSGYGGFNNSMTPFFATSNVVWMEMGGVLAIPNLRGGGEYGRKWHEAGTKAKKQNTFDDFIAAAEALIFNGYTSKKRLAIKGGSNGGLLVGACMNQRPDLFAACLPAVGVMDMLRYHKFTVGYAWAGDYGTSDDPKMFPVLRRYSPYHNLRPGVAYPPTLVTTADSDDRVVPAHSFKYAARLQACQAGKAPVLIRIETKGGHGGGTTLSKWFDATADRYAFLAKHLGMRVPRRLGK